MYPATIINGVYWNITNFDQASNIHIQNITLKLFCFQGYVNGITFYNLESDHIAII